MTNKVAILDAGAQYGKVIDRKVRELGVESEIIPLTAATDTLKQYAAIIISGGPVSVNSLEAKPYNPAIFELGVPILGVCYGLQLMNKHFGGTVEKKAVREDGQFQIKVETDSLLFDGLEPVQLVLLTHGDSADQLPAGFRQIATSNDLIAGFEDAQRKLYAVQFHPEVDLTPHGLEMYANFLFKIAQLDADYTVEDREKKAITEIQQLVGDKNVLVLLSGGVDSTVTAALLTKALNPEQIFAVHVDHGFMRQDESNQVVESLDHLGLAVKRIDAAESFAQATTQIDGQTSPPLNRAINSEVKRKIIGDMFMQVVSQTIAGLGLDPDETYLVQGTLRPDLIESASKLASSNAETIKTHHNDTELVRELRDKGRVIEPLKDYHKDEVRQLGETLGLPKELVWRQPFPGPGLAVRILCTEKPYIANYDQVYENLQQFSSDTYKLTLLPIQTVGVQGDGRSYAYAAAITGHANWSELRNLALEIPKTIHQVNRVVYLFGDVYSKPVKQITPTYLTPDVVTQLQAADAIVNQILFEYDLTQSITQVPVILVPIGFDVEANRSIAIRTMITNDFMTGIPAVPGEHIPIAAVEAMTEQILASVTGISRVMYDLTPKPPGTTEWE